MKPSTRMLTCVSAWAWLTLSLTGCSRPSSAPLAPDAVEPVTSKAAPADPNAFRTAPPKPGAPSALKYPETQHSTLASGLTTWVIPWEAPTLSLRFACLRDPDPEGKAGLSSLFTRLLTEGTKKKTALQLAVAAESLGATLNFDTTHDALSLDLSVLPEHLNEALALLAEVVRSPSLRREDFERLKKERLDDIALQRQDPQRLSWLFGYQALLGGSLGRSVSGTPKQVANLTHTDLTSYHKHALAPNRCALIAAGPVDSSGLSKAAGAHFGDWRPQAPSRPSSESPSPARAPVANRLFWIDRPGSVQTSLWVGVPAPAYGTPGHDARQVLNNLFGGLFTSRLNLNLREEHAYTYGAFSAALATRRFGAWVVSTNVETQTTQAALTEIFAELTKLKQPGNLTQAEVSRSVTDLVFGVAAQLEHTDHLLESATTQFIHQLPLNRFSTYKDTLSQLNQQTIFAQTEQLPDQGFTIVVVGDRKSVGALDKFAAESQTVDTDWLE